LQADLKVFFRFGVFGQSAVTAVVAENTLGVQAVEPMTPAFVATQIDSCLSDIGADVVKTGMLVNAAIVEVVAERLAHYKVQRLVIDPVMRAKSGDPLIAPEAVDSLVRHLFPMATVVMPNVPEAEVLWGRPIHTVADFRAAAEAIRALGPQVVVMKGGHSPTNPEGESVDYVWDGQTWLELIGVRGSDRNTHGTGCTFSAAVAARMALGDDPIQAITIAKQYITAAIGTAADLGHGHGPVNHWADWGRNS
jgi:hydroxymethylpyrimidine/phosphomethylpyrimidine kinase